MLKRVKRGKGITALLLAAATMMAALGFSASAADMPVTPTVATSAEQPIVTLQGNFTVDTAKRQADGFFELSVLVKTPTLIIASDGTVLGNTDGFVTPAGAAITGFDPLDVPTYPIGYTLERTTLRSGGFTLQYNHKLLLPVSWDFEVATEGNSNLYYPDFYDDLDNSGASELLRLEANRDRFLASDAYATRGWGTMKNQYITSVSAATGGSEGLTVGNNGLMSITLTADDHHYTEETVVAVVKFKYIGDQRGVNEPYDRMGYGSDVPLGDIVKWDPTVAEGGGFKVEEGYSVLRTRVDEKSLVWLASDEDLYTTGSLVNGSPVEQAAYFTTGNYKNKSTGANEFYETLTVDLAASQGRIPFKGTPISLDNNRFVTGNDIETSNTLRFRTIAAKSYTSGGADLDNVSVVLFYDWDDTLLGVLVVPKGDATQMVNAYVEENFIHPELQESANAFATLDRTDTYRGKYPHSGPLGVSGEIKYNGEVYPLTNKLDYSFWTRPVSKNGNMWQTAAADNAAANPYPYANGWAVVKNMEDIANVWTTFGVGELSGITLGAKSVPASFTGDGVREYLEFADFSDVKDDFLYVKACYEPGVMLALGQHYSLAGGYSVEYLRYGNIASTDLGSAYSISYAYERIDVNGYGVNRIREPILRYLFTEDTEDMKKTIYDLTGSTEADKSFYQTLSLPNTEIIPIELTPSGFIKSIDYALVDVFGVENFTAGANRTIDGNDLNIYNNFDYGLVNNVYDDRQGTNGFVYRATLNQLNEFALVAVSSGMTSDRSNFINLISVATLQDMNLRMKDSENSIRFPNPGMELNDIANLIYDYYQRVYFVGGETALVSTDWHQLQYHVLTALLSNAGNMSVSNGVYNFSANTIMSEADVKAAYGGGFAWCRFDFCGGVDINSVAKLIIEAYKYYYGSGSDAYNSLSLNKANDLFLMKNEKGEPFSTTVEFKLAMEAAIDKLVAYDSSFNESKAANITWKQLQYLLLSGTSYISDNYIINPSNIKDITTPVSSPNVLKYFFWENGGAPAINDIYDLIRVSYAAFQGVNGVKYDSTVMSSLVSNFPLLAGQINGNVAIPGSMWLRQNTNGDSFISSAALLASLEKAVARLVAAGISFDSLGSMTWLEVQNILLDNSYKDNATLLADDFDDVCWWYNGGSKPMNTLNALLEAVRNNDTTSLASVSYALLYNTDYQDQFGFAKDFMGTKYTDDADVAANFVAKLQTLTPAQLNSMINMVNLRSKWNMVQYFLINGQTANGTYYDTDGNKFYWWYNGGTPQPVDFSSVSSANLVPFIEAAFRAQYNGNTHAWDNLTETVIKNAKFAKAPIAGTESKYPDNFAVYSGASDMADFGAKVQAMLVASGLYTPASGGGVTSIPALTSWYTLQHYLVANTYESEAAIETWAQSAHDKSMSDWYWWKDASSKGTVPVIWTNLVTALEAYANSGTTLPSGIYTYTYLGISTDKEAALQFTNASGSTGLSSLNASGVRSRMQSLVTNILNDPAKTYVSGTTGSYTLYIDWYQVLYAIWNNGALTDPTTAKNAVTSGYPAGNTPPPWAASTITSKPVALMEELSISQVDETEELPEDVLDEIEPEVEEEIITEPEEPTVPEEPEESEEPIEPDEPNVPEEPEDVSEPDELHNLSVVNDLLAFYTEPDVQLSDELPTLRVPVTVKEINNNLYDFIVIDYRRKLYV